MTARRVGPKTDPSRSELYYKTATRRRALKALDGMLAAYGETWRWRQIAAWTPPNEKWSKAKAEDRAAQALKRMQGFQRVVWAALGYDPESDAPPPKTHWDKGAMQDPADEGVQPTVAPD